MNKSVNSENKLGKEDNLMETENISVSQYQQIMGKNKVSKINTNKSKSRVNTDNR